MVLLEYIGKLYGLGIVVENVPQQHFHNFIIITLKIVNTIGILFMIKFFKFFINLAAFIVLLWGYPFVLVFDIVKRFILMNPVFCVDSTFFFFKKITFIDGHKKYVKAEYIFLTANVSGSTTLIAKYSLTPPNDTDFSILYFQ